MTNMWLKIRIWSKVTFASLLAIAVLVFVVNNMNKPVRVWLWPNYEPEATLLIVLFFTVVLSVIGTLLLRTTMKTIRQIKELRERSRLEKHQRRVAEMEATVSRLQTKTTPVEPTKPDSSVQP